MPLLKKSNTCLLIINAEYDKIPGPGRAFYGGKAIPFMSSINVRLLQPARVPADHNQPIKATVIRPLTIKNKTAQNGRQPDPGITFKHTAAGVRVDYVPELLEVGKQLGVFTDDSGAPISGSKKWHFAGEPLETGRDKVLALLYASEDLRNRVEDAIYDAIAAENEDTTVEDVIPNPVEEPDLEEVVDLEAEIAERLIDSDGVIMGDVE